MRGAFAKTLAELAREDERILLITGDLGYMALEVFADEHPKRFFNAGVAEQNMVGMATGLAEAGFIPFVYSIVTFATLRPYEFIRNGPIRHNLPVRVVGVGGGFEYGHNGLTHFGLEDVGVMRVQPGMRVLAPADHQQARNALLATWSLPGPSYFRLGKDDKTTVPGLDGRFAIGRVQRVRDGADAVIVVMGSIATDAVLAADTVSGQGRSCGVIVVDQFDDQVAADLVREIGTTPVVVSMEAHYVNGGLGSFVAETLAERGLPARLVRCGVRSTPAGITGSQSFMHRANELSAEQVAARTLDAIAHVTS